MFEVHLYLDTGEVFVDKGPVANIENLTYWLANHSWYVIRADATRGTQNVLIDVSHIAYIKLKPSEEE